MSFLKSFGVQRTSFALLCLSLCGFALLELHFGLWMKLERTNRTIEQLNLSPTNLEDESLEHFNDTIF